VKKASIGIDLQTMRTRQFSGTGLECLLKRNLTAWPLLAAMVAPLVCDELWQEIAPLPPPERAKPKGGRPRVADRACLAGIVFVLRTGIGPLRPSGDCRATLAT
jgi:hypothetical protein